MFRDLGRALGNSPYFIIFPAKDACACGTVVGHTSGVARCADRMSLEDFRTLRPSGDNQVTPEWVIEHLAQHEAEHRGQIWEARVAGERALGINATDPG
jgi:hypothetical protein